MISSAGTFSFMAPVSKPTQQQQIIDNLTKHFTPIENKLQARPHAEARIITDEQNVPKHGISALSRKRTAYFDNTDCGSLM